LSSAELELVQRYVERRNLLLPDTAKKAAQRIAAALRPKLSVPSGELEDDDGLLLRIDALRTRRR
jgi:hypothetical protein